MNRVGFVWLLICAVFGLAGTGYAAFSSHHSNPAHFRIIDDYMPPTLASVAQKNEGGVAGFVRSGQPFRVLAAATDDGAPPSGIQGVTSAGPGAGGALAAAANSVMGVDYGFVSADRTVTAANGAVISGTTVARDNNGYESRVAVAVTVDDVLPAATDVNTSNAATGVAGRISPNDLVDFTYSEPIDPFSLFGSKWNWITKTASGGTLVCNPFDPNTGRTLFLIATNPAQTLGTFSSTGSYCSETITATVSFLNPSPNVIRVRLGTVSGASKLLVDSTLATTSWWTTSGTSIQPYDRAGNRLPSGLTVLESGPADMDF